MSYKSRVKTRLKPVVCHITTVHTDRFDTRIFRKECSSLANAGYKVSLLVADGKGDEIKNGVKIIDLGKQAKTRARRIVQSNSMLLYRMKDLKADIIHFHDPELIPFFLFFKRKHPSIRIVFDIHENFSEKLLGGRDWIPSFLRSSFSFSFRTIENRAKKKFDGFVGATDLIASSYPSKKSISLHNYPELRDYENFAEPSKDKEKGRIVYTGGFTAHRGISQVVEALQYVTNNVELHVFGRQEDHIHRHCKSLVGYEKVTYHGKVDLLEMLNQVHKCEIGLVCNQPEGGYQFAMPNKLFEYMACNVPVIASNFDHWKEILEENKAGLTVDSTNPKEIAKAIDLLLSNNNRAIEMGQNARKCVENIYNWNTEFSKLENLYNQIVSL